MAFWGRIFSQKKLWSKTEAAVFVSKSFGMFTARNPWDVFGFFWERQEILLPTSMFVHLMVGGG